MAPCYSRCSPRCAYARRNSLPYPFAHPLSTPHSDETYFQKRTSQTGAQDNWVLRFTALKSLYKLMTQYFTDVLYKPTKNLEAPNLQGVAKDYSTTDTLILCRMAIAIGVQCERNKEFIAKIQALNESDQHNLMRAIESVRGRCSLL